MSHTVEILSVGTELLLGNIVNLDAQILSQGLSALGLNVYWHTVVGTTPSGPGRRWLPLRGGLISSSPPGGWAPPVMT